MLPWSASSPDFSLMKQLWVWDINNQIRLRDPPPQSVVQLYLVYRGCWVTPHRQRVPVWSHLCHRDIEQCPRHEVVTPDLAIFKSPSHNKTPQWTHVIQWGFPTGSQFNPYHTISSGVSMLMEFSVEIDVFIFVQYTNKGSCVVYLLADSHQTAVQKIQATPPIEQLSVQLFCNITWKGHPGDIISYEWKHRGVILWNTKKYTGLATDVLKIQVKSHLLDIQCSVSETVVVFKYSWMKWKANSKS